ncbi:MAG: nucleotidyltransferase family protein [Methylococcaceae bacterium]
MNDTGLTNVQIELLAKIFRKYAAIQSVKLYGSRAKGTFNDRSDIDLVVFGEDIDRFLISDILLELDDSDLPCSVDLHNYKELKNQALKEHIDRVGVLIYGIE